MTDRGRHPAPAGQGFRRDEPDLHRATYQELGIPIIGEIQAPGTVEGGDTLWIDENTLAIGRGYRTNSEGIRQLTAILLPARRRCWSMTCRTGTAPAECLHLMSMISPVAETLLSSIADHGGGVR